MWKRAAFCHGLAVRFTIVYSDYQYLLARQCFDYVDSLDNEESSVGSCDVERSALVLYGRSPRVPLSNDVIRELLKAARLPASCGHQMHQPTRDHGSSFHKWHHGRRSLWDRGDTSPQYLDRGDMITNVPPNIYRVISATFYPCNIFLINWKSF